MPTFPKIVLDLKNLTQQEQDFLNDLQGNILKGHGREHVGLLFFTVDPSKVAAAKGDIKAFPVTSAQAQLDQTARFKATCGQDAGGFFRALFLSHFGYVKLGVPQAKIPTNASFVAGAKKQASALNDPPVGQWDPGFQLDVDGMFLVANADLGALTDEMMSLREKAQAWALSTPAAPQTEITIEEGVAYKNANGDGLENFGYVDGRSQPLMIQQDIDVERVCGGGVDQYDPTATLDLVVVPDPLGTVPGASYGSYFVFRKLEQNVKAFLEQEDSLARALKLFGSDFDRSGAMVVGRFEDGTPLAVSDDDGLACPVSNNFNYNADPHGNGCPLQAHIRKSNPRNGALALTKRMARRGITYGQRAVNPDKTFADRPEKNVGLLFMSYQQAIDLQFEFIQEQWVNSQGFPQAGIGLDPVIGQAPAGSTPTPQTWRPEYGIPTPSTTFGYNGFVTMKGGEYFFAPSLSAIKAL